MTRREFTKNTLKTSIFISSIPITSFTNLSPKRNIQKGTMLHAIRVGETVMEKFMFAKQAGFEGLEVLSHLDRKEVLNARDKTGLKIPTVLSAVHGRYLLSDPNPLVRNQGVEALKHTLEDANIYGADTASFMPGSVNENVSYDECWDRSVDEIKKVIPLAEKLKIHLAIENAGKPSNRHFLESPLTTVGYIDQFKNPWVKVNFDTGNVLELHPIPYYSGPEQWIRILGERIVKVHFKDRTRTGDWHKITNLLEGDTNWLSVMKALDEIGYNDWIFVEHRADTIEDLSDLSRRLTTILSM